LKPVIARLVRHVTVGALLVLAGLAAAGLALGGAAGPYPDGPPQRMSTYESFAVVAVIVLGFSIASLRRWHPGGRSPRRTRGLALLGVAAALALAGGAVYADVAAPHNLPGHARNAPLAQRRATGLGLAAIAAAAATVLGVMRIEHRKNAAALHRRTGAAASS
jgi:hypothetical protein